MRRPGAWGGRRRVAAAGNMYRVSGRGVGNTADSGLLQVDGQEFKVTSLGRVHYPASKTSKAEVIRYWAAVADVALPHLTGRPATRKRWPEGCNCSN